MKIIKMFSKSEFLVEDDEAENVAANYGKGGLILLRSGNYISTAGIESIADPETVPFWKDYLLEKGGRSFIRDGQRINLEAQNFKEIEYKPHPKYEAMRKALIEKTKMISDGQRTEIGEEIAKIERKNK